VDRPRRPTSCVEGGCTSPEPIAALARAVGARADSNARHATIPPIRTRAIPTLASVTRDRVRVLQQPLRLAVVCLAATLRARLRAPAAACPAGHLGAFLSGFRESDRDGLLPARDVSTVSVLAAPERTALTAMHRALDGLGGGRSITAASAALRLSSRCHPALLTGMDRSRRT
jgi:hypothetical protein